MKQPPDDLDPLCAIVCGYEKSGTTVLNEILRRHPQLDSGHEVGALLANSPRDFPRVQPYFAYFQQTWKLSREATLECCDTEEWAIFYQRIRAASPVIVDKSSFIFDKTPRYMLYLNEVMDRVSCLPCVVCVRDPRAVMHSWANWSGHKEDAASWLEQNFESNCGRYISYARGYSEAEATGKFNLHLNRFEVMCLHPRETIEAVFNFLGMEYSDDYLVFDSEHFVYGNTISRNHLFSYRKDFSDTLCQRILDATADYSDWHFHG